MSFPNHILLDFNFKKSNYLTPYWTLKFIEPRSISPSFLDDVSVKSLFHKEVIKLDWISFLKNNYNLNKPQKLNKFNLILNSNPLNENFSNYYQMSDSVNVNFLRYERLYTKLKYSRSPAYDIVSGGAAALCAGFLGFLISEKFGFELVDSGDFYYLFMYFVFLSFLVKPLLYTANAINNPLSTLSIKNISTFFIKLVILFVQFIKKFI